MASVSVVRGYATESSNNFTEKVIFKSIFGLHSFYDFLLHPGAGGNCSGPKV